MMPAERCEFQALAPVEPIDIYPGDVIVVKGAAVWVVRWTGRKALTWELEPGERAVLLQNSGCFGGFAAALRHAIQPIHVESNPRPRASRRSRRARLELVK